jgi:hypothetical protein
MKAYMREPFEQSQLFMTGHSDDKVGKSIRFFTLPCVPGLIHVLTFVVMHSVVPIVAAVGIIQLCARREEGVPREFFFLLATYVYLAMVANIAEYGENMRFRLSVEPVIWLISVWSLMLMYPLAGRLVRRIRQVVGRSH